MFPNRSERAQIPSLDRAVVIDLEGERTVRRDRRIEAATADAASALARFEAGRGTWGELMAALIAPFKA